MPFLVLLLPVMLAAAQETPMSAKSDDLSAYPDAAGMPSDVQNFIVDYDDCQHWMGEEPYDAQRAQEIDDAVRKLCPGIDARRQRLIKRYHANIAVSARLRTYERLGQ